MEQEKIERVEKEIESLQERGRRFETDIEALQERNRRVEREKAWETSNFRVVLLTLSTYVASAIFLRMIDRKEFLIEAFAPAFGYILSTLSLPALKRWWMKKFLRESGEKR